MIDQKTLSHVKRDIERLDAAREDVLRTSRELIRRCGRAIHSVHQGEPPKSAMADCAALHEELLSLAGAFPPELVPGAPIVQAQQEYTEMAVIMAVALGRPPPTAGALKVSSVAYLYGLADAMGEMRRMALTALLDGDAKRARDMLTRMDSLFDCLMAVGVYGVASELRHKIDGARGILERTRGDVATSAVRAKGSGR